MLLKYLFIFAIFSVVGWILEVTYRSITNKKFINPGFLSGCAIPLYGFGVVILNIICNIFININTNHKLIVIFFISTILLTLLEFLTGRIMLDLFHVKLWDYSNVRFNYKGIICPQFSVIWGALALLFYLLVFPGLNTFILKLVSSTLCIFILGIFYGIFIIDLCMSINLLSKLTKYSKRAKKIINFEKLKIDSIKKTGKKFWNVIYPYTHINKFLKDKIKK